jgi:hypothetical protein
MSDADNRRSLVVLSERYLRLLKQVEALPQNQNGADKTWVETLLSQRSRLSGRRERIRTVVWAGHWAAGLLPQASLGPRLRRRP